MKAVLVLRKDDKTARAKAKGLGLAVEVRSGWQMAGDRTVFVDSANVNWSLVPAGLHVLEHWDMAAPLWRYGVLAKDVGTPEERQRTEAIVRDLRVPLYAHELLFVGDTEGGRVFLGALEEESQAGGEIRLAFLRALYRTKPRFCALPRTWLLDVQEQSLEAARRRKATTVPIDDRGLVLVEVRRNVFVKCRPGEEQKVIDDYKLRHMRREERKKVGI